MAMESKEQVMPKDGTVPGNITATRQEDAMPREGHRPARGNTGNEIEAMARANIDPRGINSHRGAMTGEKERPDGSKERRPRQ